MKKKKNDAVTRIYVILTAILIIFAGVFCTSPSKAVDDPFIPVVPDETSDTDEAEATEEITRIIYETIGEDLTLPADPDTDVSDTSASIDDPAETSAVTKAVTTEPQTEPPRYSGEFSELTFKEYTGRELGPDESIYDRYENDRFSLIITKVEKGDLNYFICDINLNSPNDLHTAFAENKITGRAYTSKTASQVGAVFAVNGDFCGFRSSGIIIREGTLYRNKNSSWDFCYIDKNGDLITTKHSTVDARQLVADGALQSWSFGPALLKDGRALTKDEFVTPGLSRTAREPRTAIGQAGKLHYIIIVVDAVRTGNKTIGGMTFADLAITFESLGCSSAYNLDGGGSTTLYYKGKVINEPCVNGERNVSDIVYLK